jgi:hypothetical protein
MGVHETLMYQTLETLGQLLRWDFLGFCELLRAVDDETLARLQALLSEPGWALHARKAVEVEVLRRDLAKKTLRGLRCAKLRGITGRP